MSAIIISTKRNYISSKEFIKILSEFLSSWYISLMENSTIFHSIFCLDFSYYQFYVVGIDSSTISDISISMFLYLLL